MKRKALKFTKHDSHKSRLDLLPAEAIEFVGQVLRHGAVKYAPGNWRKCKDPSRYVAAMLRHVLRHMRGEFTDKDSGLPGLAHAVCSGLFALDLYLKGAQDSFTMGNYFALVERKSAKRGLVKKRFKKFETAWAYLEDQGLDPEKHVIKTLPHAIRVGSSTKL